MIEKNCSCGKPAVVKYRSPAIAHTHHEVSFKVVTIYDPPEVDGVFCDRCFVALIKERRPAARAAAKARRAKMSKNLRGDVNLGPCGCNSCERDRAQRREAEELREWRRPDHAALSVHRVFGAGVAA